MPPLRPEWRLVPAEQWHVTLAFLGEVSEALVPELGERLSRSAARSGPLSLGFAGAGAFPSTRHARVLWAGLAGDRAGLVRLAERAAAAARRTGVPLADRPYRPHLTLARARPPRGTDATEPVVALTAYTGPIWPAAEVVLVHSVIGATVRHEQIAGWPVRH